MSKLRLFARMTVLAIVCAMCLQGRAQTSPVAYGILLFDQQNQVTQLVSFPFPEMTGFEEIQDFGSLYLSAGVYYDGYYYASSNGYATTNVKAEELLRIDLETGERATVGEFSGFSNKIADMTVDYSTGTCYAVSGSIGGSEMPGSSALYTIDLTTAKAVKVADMDNFYFSLACSYGGQLYGVTKYGNFMAIDKLTGEETLIGKTEMRPTGDCSMEFDHTDKTLWWTMNALVQTTGGWDTEESYVCKIDVETGLATIVSMMGSAGDASVAGLYVPFTASADGTPVAVSDFTVTPDPNGACSAELKWINPTAVFGGGELTSITSVNIYRNEVLVKSLDGMIPGETASWTDNIEGETGLLATYEIAAVNEKGRGVLTDTTVFVGEDVPGEPANVLLTKVHPDEVAVTWDAPNTGANGGWYDRSTLTYNVVRQPDGMEIGAGLTEPACTDAGIKQVATYTYEITASTKAGKGTSATSDVIVLGPGNKLPYSCSFANADEVATWTIIDADGDGRTWSQGYSYGSMQYNNAYNSTTPSDDWLISHDFELKAGKNYKGTFAIKTQTSAKMKVFLGQGSKVEDMTEVLYENEALKSLSSSVFSTIEYTFTVKEDGIYNIGFYIYSDPRTYFTYLTDITLEEVADNNLTVLGFSGPKNAVVGNSYTYNVEVANKGVNAADAFQVLLKDAQGSTLATVDVAEALETGASRIVEISWTPETEGAVTVHAEVAYAKDEVSGDNSSESIEVTVLPEGSAEFVEIGTITGSSRYILFDVYNSNAAALNIYTPSEIGKEDGVVESFNFTVQNGMSDARNGIPVKVYMANTDLTQATTWIPEAEMTLVYDGTIDIPSGTSEITLELQKKFYFEQGKNLAILTVNDLPDGTYYNGINYPCFSTDDSVGTYYWGSSYTAFSFNTTTANYGNTKFGSKASVTLQMRCDGASIKGSVTDMEGTPIAGAEVTIVERNITVETDAEGNYELKYVPDGDYTVTVTKQDYATVTKNVSITGGADAVLNATLVELHACSVSGIVTTLDKQPVAGATVNLSGYEDYTTTTDDSGAYTFESVYVSDISYRLTVKKEWFAEHIAEVPVIGVDIKIDSIKLEYLKYAPVNVLATESDAGVTVNWQAASNATTLRTDGGTLNGNLGISAGNENTVLGTIYREPMALTEVSWYQTLAGGPHYYVNVFVLALDEEGNPTSDVLYTEEVAATDDQWNTHVLPDTVFAPNGCVIGLSYMNGYLGIGIDGGKDLVYPFKENTHVFAATYTNGEFDFVERDGIRSNLMIRGKGYRLADNGGESSLLADGEAMPDFCTYNVWRVKHGDEGNATAWVPVTSVAQSDMTVADNLAGAEAGMYAYAVKTVYPDGSESEAAFSPLMAHNMYARVVVNVKSNSEGEGATGAVVTLNGNTYGSSYTAVVDEAGAATFDNLVKDTYKLTITLAGYENVNTSVNFSSDDDYSTDAYLLKEIIVAPENLKVELVNGSTSSVLFTWNTTDPIEEDFESCEDFEINPAGDAGWTYIDGDDQYTYGFQNAEFTNMNGKMAFMAFNPSSVNPSQAENELLEPHSGDKFLASFVALGGSDDWFISPELSYASDFGFSFYVSSYDTQDGNHDIFCVGYTLEADPTTDDFVWLAKNVKPVTGWTEYSYTVPAAAKHVAIRNVSTEEYGFILMIDDVKIGQLPVVSRMRAASASAVQTPGVTYEVYLDGNSLGETSEISWQFDNVSAGEHTAGVKAVYNSGESEMVTITFDTQALGVEDAYGNSLKVYPNPVSDRLVVEGEYTRLMLTNMSGATVMMLDDKQSSVDVSSLPAGMYILTIIDDNAGTRATRKISVVR